MRETRAGLAEIRAVDVDGAPGVTLHCIRPGVVDDYGSLWMPDVFDKSLARRLPTLCWSHDWNEPLGPATGYKTSSDGPTVTFRFSDFDAVPQARRAHAQVVDGTLQDCSVGFSNTQRRDPTPEEREAYTGVREVMLEADLDEVSLVLRGAVPGAKILAVRSGDMVDKQFAAQIIAQLGAGQIDLADALTQLKTGSAVTGPMEAIEVAEGETGEVSGDGSGEVLSPIEQDDELDAEVDVALAVLGRY